MTMPMPVTTVPVNQINPLSLFYVVNLVIALFVVILGGWWLFARWQNPSLHLPLSPPIPARRMLTYGLGGLWLLDGLLQAQPAMVTRFIGGILVPLGSGEPHFVAILIHLGAQIWHLNPVVWNLGATWIQIGIGVLLLVSGESRGRRIALYGSIGWGLVVWTSGEAFGSIFQGGSWLSGSPGSVFFYILAAIVLLLPVSRWDTSAMVRGWRLALAGVWWLAFGLQIWPANGWWTTTTARYVRAMASMPQPPFISGPLETWARMLQHHPLAWNLGLSLAFLALALGWTIRPPSRWVWSLTMLFTLATWAFGQDFGVLGGMGTDPNSGIVLLLGLMVYASMVHFFTWPTWRLPVLSHRRHPVPHLQADLDPIKDAEAADSKQQRAKP